MNCNQQHALRIWIEATGNSKGRTTLWRERCCILRQINQRLWHLACRNRHTGIRDYTLADDSCKMFRAVCKSNETYTKTTTFVYPRSIRQIHCDWQRGSRHQLKWFKHVPTILTVVPLAPFVGSVSHLISIWGWKRYEVAAEWTCTQP